MKDILLICTVAISASLILFMFSILKINKDLSDSVEYYKSMYYEKDAAVRILQEECFNK